MSDGTLAANLPDVPNWNRHLGLTILLSLAIGCSTDEAPPDAVVSIPALCCPIEEPTCDCFSTGGTRNGNDPRYGCGGICDAPPDGWNETVDENGCPVLEWVGADRSCLSFPDAGLPDAEVSDAEVPDAD